MTTAVGRHIQLSHGPSWYPIGNDDSIGACTRRDCDQSPKYDIEKYTLDFALVDGERRLDIEVDGEHHRDWTGDLCRRDIIRNQRMIELGWDVMRFWVYELENDMESCTRRVKEWKESSASAG